MANRALQRMKVVALATDGFEEPELTEPVKALEVAAAREVTIRGRR